MIATMRRVLAICVATSCFATCHAAPSPAEPSAAVERSTPAIVERLLEAGVGGDKAKAIAEVDEAVARWDVDRADALVSELLRKRPADPSVLLAAARVRFYESDYTGCRDMAQRAAAIPDADADAAKDARSLVAWLDERSATWSSFKEHRSEHFIVRTTERDEILAPYALAALDGAAKAMQEELGFSPTRPVIVELYPSRRAFIAASTLTREEVETSGTLAICHFNRLMVLSPGVLARGYDWLDAVCHEFVHFAVYHVGGNTVPVWLHEGIAKTLESRWRLPQPEPLDPRLASVLAEGLEGGKWVTFDQMHPSMAKLPSAALVSMAFAEVATTVQMMRQQRGPQSTKDVVVALRENDGDLDKALRSAWGMTVGELETRAKEHARSMKLERVPGLLVFDDEKPKAGAGLDFQDEGEKPDDPEAEAKKLEDRKAQDFAILGDRLKGRKFYDAAIIEYDKALQRLGAGEPIVVNKKAHALLLAGRPEEAKPILEESLRWNPAMAVTLDNLAEVHLRLAASAKDPKSSDDQYHVALDLAQQSERVNPFSTDTHLRLASLYDRFGMTEQAKAARDRLALLRDR